LTLRTRPGTEPAVPARRDPLPLVLASASPRRRDLLARAGLRFEVLPADVPEEPRAGEGPRALVERLAAAKAASVRDRLPPLPHRFVLGSDTVVALGEDVLGKPSDAEHALAMLRRLAGRTHTVWTGVALAATGREALRVTSVASRVTFRAASEAELRAYVASGESLDKAGAYALQGEGRGLVRRIEGSESNVVGLPLEETLALLAEAGLEPRAS
jgi:septum formation protein